MWYKIPRIPCFHEDSRFVTSKKFHLKVENATKWKTIFAYRSLIELWLFSKELGDEISDDFIKIMCCQKLQKVGSGRVNKEGLATEQAQYSHFPPRFENWRADLCVTLSQIWKKVHSDFDFFTFYLIKCVILVLPAMHPGDWPEWKLGRLYLVIAPSDAPLLNSKYWKRHLVLKFSTF